MTFRHFCLRDTLALILFSSAVDVTCFTEEENMFVDLFTLLYADDTNVLAENAEELQLALDALFDYQLWHLTVNTCKN